MIVNDCRIIYSTNISPSNLCVKYTSRDYQYPISETNFINKQWELALSKHSNKSKVLFNGRLFSLLNHTEDNGRLVLELGNTDYATYVGTRVHGFTECYPNSPRANPLAVCAALITNDHKIVMEQRAGGDVYSNFSHVIGGFIDRELDTPNNDGSLDPFSAMVREIQEELYIDLGNSQGILTGLVYDERTPHPELCFSFSVNHSLPEIVEEVERHSEREVNRLFGIENSPEKLRSFLVKNYLSISVTGFGCLLLLGRVKFGNHWYEEASKTLQSLQRSPL